MAYGVIMLYHLHMPSYILRTFTEYPFLVNTKNSIFVMRITVVYFVNVTCTYSSILVKWVSFISGYTNISILVFL